MEFQIKMNSDETVLFNTLYEYFGDERLAVKFTYKILDLDDYSKDIYHTYLDRTKDVRRSVYFAEEVARLPAREQDLFQQRFSETNDLDDALDFAYMYYQ